MWLYVMAHTRNARGKHELTANLQADNGTRNLNMMECQDTAKVHLKTLNVKHQPKHFTFNNILGISK